MRAQKLLRVRICFHRQKPPRALRPRFHATSGFFLNRRIRKGYSTEQAILEITDNMKLATDKGQITCGLFLDLSKAFDTVNHKILLSKLYLYGIRGTSHNLFESYLHNRRKYVKIDSTKSRFENINCGIPQGSTQVLFYFCSM